MRVFITGGANGIGRDTAERLLADGNDVIVYDRDEDALKALPDSITTITGDVRDDDRLANVIGREELDVVIACAGYQRLGAVEDMELGTFRDHMETNYFGVLHTVKPALRTLIENEGRLVLISSLAGQIGLPYTAGYCASKHAVEALGDALRFELRDDRVEVVIVEPGPITTGFNERGLEHVKTFLPNTRYQEVYERHLPALEKERGIGGWSTEAAGKVVYTAATAKHPRARYTVPRYIWPVRILNKVLPAFIRDRLMRFY